MSELAKAVLSLHNPNGLRRPHGIMRLLSEGNACPETSRFGILQNERGHIQGKHVVESVWNADHQNVQSFTPHGA